MKEENKISGFSNWKKNFPSFEKLFSQIIERRIWEKRRLWEENKPPGETYLTTFTTKITWFDKACFGGDRVKKVVIS